MLIRTKDKEALCAIFSNVQMPPFEVWAYGSRVSGEAHEGSDLDLVIRPVDLSETPAEVLQALKLAIRESNIPIIVELSDWARLPLSFHKNIENQYEVLYASL